MFIVACAEPSGWWCGEVFEGVGHKCRAPAPQPSQGPAHRLRQKWFLLEQINRFLAGTDCVQGPVLASIQTNLLWTFQSVCAPIQSWILLLNFKVVMSDFC